METQKTIKSLVFLVLLPLCLGLLYGCAPGGKGAGVMKVTAPEPAYPANKPSQDGDFRIKEGDVLGLVFMNNPELNSEQVVRPDGKITVKLIGDMVAAGLTPMELEDAILRRYVDFVANSRYTRVFKEGDYFDLRFVYNPELNIGVRVRSDGKISLPMVGDVPAAGLTPEQLRKNLVKRYSRDLRNPDIVLLVSENTARTIHTAENSLAVSVNRAAGHRVYVMGEVKNPRVVAADVKLTLLQALAEAGGATDTGDMGRVVILRRLEEKKVEWLQVDLDSPPEGTDMKNDILVHAGDIVIVPKTGIAKLNLWVKQYIRGVLPVDTQFSINANLLNSGVIP